MAAAACAVLVAAFAPGASAAEVSAPADVVSPAGTVDDAAAKLVVDGHLEDLAAYVKALRAAGSKDAIAEVDAAGDVRVFDPGIVAGRPIENHYFANGFDQTYDLFAYDR